jgi:hypothetical protein
MLRATTPIKDVNQKHLSSPCCLKNSVTAVIMHNFPVPPGPPKNIRRGLLFGVNKWFAIKENMCACSIFNSYSNIIAGMSTMFHLLVG